jgi:hypothetical protein
MGVGVGKACGTHNYHRSLRVKIWLSKSKVIERIHGVATRPTCIHIREGTGSFPS